MELIINNTDDNQSINKYEMKKEIWAETEFIE
jgi:hypothetical protein